MHGAVCDVRPPLQQACERPPRRVRPLEALLTPYLRAWERHEVWFGTRLWDGWSFEEYTAQFPATRLEIGPWWFPPPSFFDRLRTRMNEHGRVTVIVTDDVFFYRFPHGHPDPRCRGERNEQFLDPAGLEGRVLECLRRLGDSPVTVVLNIPRIYPTEGAVFGQVLSRLDRLLSELPRTWRCAVALHNSGYLLPDYLACLRDHGVGHVLRCSTTMPPLLEQVQMPGIFGAGPAVVDVPAEGFGKDALLGITEAVRCALEEDRPLCVFAGDQPEECTLALLLAVMTMLNPELAKRSVLRRCAA